MMVSSWIMWTMGTGHICTVVNANVPRLRLHEVVLLRLDLVAIIQQVFAVGAVFAFPQNDGSYGITKLPGP